MKTINNKDDWDDFYFYKGYKPKKYPKQYPCLAKRETEGGGIVGEYEAHYVVYPPADNLIDHFVLGLNAKWEYVC
jgi:hypothetical protein